MTDLIVSCLDFVFYPLTSSNTLIIVPFFLMVFTFVVRMVYNLAHITTR